MAQRERAGERVLEAGARGGELTALGEPVASATSRPKAMAAARGGAFDASTPRWRWRLGGGQSVNRLCREMVDQLQWGERQRRGAVTLWFGQPVDDTVDVEQFQTLQHERRAGTIAQQPLPVRKRGRRDRARPRTPRHRARTRCWAGWGPKGSHFADVITLDQRAAGKPPQHPHAYLLGDGDDGRWRQCRSGAKAHGLRVITGLLGRLESRLNGDKHTVPVTAKIAEIAIIIDPRDMSQPTFRDKQHRKSGFRMYRTLGLNILERKSRRVVDVGNQSPFQLNA